MALTLDGWDVSYAQGVIDWAKVATASPKFVACKATQFQPDIRFAADQAGMRTYCQSAVRVYYHFLTGEPAHVQADRFYATVGPLQPGELPALDVEASPPAGIPEFAPEFVLAVLAEVEQRFRRAPLVYMGAYYRQAADTRYRHNLLWLPGYSDNPRTVRPYAVHQFTDRSSMPGHNGNVDGNHVADLAALRAAAGATTPTPAPALNPGGPMAALIQHVVDKRFERIRITDGVSAGQQTPGILQTRWQSTAGSSFGPYAALNTPGQTWVPDSLATDVGADGNPVITMQDSGTNGVDYQMYFEERSTGGFVRGWHGPTPL